MIGTGLIMDDDPNIIVFDSFNRVDNTETMGNADTGQIWVPFVGIGGIINSRARCVSTSGGQFGTYIDAIVSNCILGCVLSTIGANQRLLFRGVDNINRFSLNISGGVYVLGITVDGITTSLITAECVAVNNDRINIILNGSLIRIYVNENIVIDTTDERHLNGTKYGIGATSTGVRWDNFKITSLF
jgi:hypothetical protein